MLLTLPALQRFHNPKPVFVVLIAEDALAHLWQHARNSLPQSLKIGQLLTADRVEFLHIPKTVVRPLVNVHPLFIDLIHHVDDRAGTLLLPVVAQSVYQ